MTRHVSDLHVPPRGVARDDFALGARMAEAPVAVPGTHRESRRPSLHFSTPQQVQWALRTRSARA